MAVHFENCGPCTPDPKTMEYLNKAGPPITKIALYSIAQFVMHLIAYGLVIGILAVGAAGAFGAFGDIATIYRVLVGGAALFVAGGGSYVTKFMVPDFSRKLDLEIEEAEAELDAYLNPKKAPDGGDTSDSVDTDDNVDSVQGDAGLESGHPDQ